MKTKRIKSKRVKSKRVKSRRIKSKRVKSKRKKSYSATGIAIGIGIPIALGLGGLGYYYYKKLPENQLRQEAPSNNLQSVIDYDENEINAYLSKIFTGSIRINRDITEAQLQQYMKDILPDASSRYIQKLYKYRAAIIALQRLELNSINNVNTDYEEQFIRNPSSAGPIYISKN